MTTGLARRALAHGLVFNDARPLPKVVAAALELMPAGPPWPEDEYAEWIDYFDRACRIYYRLPSKVRADREGEPG